MSLFKSKAEKEAVGEVLVCAVCGSKRYALKTNRLPHELIGKYSLDSMLRCARCGKYICGASFGVVGCFMRGCPCGGTDYVHTNVVSKH